MYCIYVAILVKNDQQIIQIVEALKKAQAFEIYSSCSCNSNLKQLLYNFWLLLCRRCYRRNISEIIKNNALIIYDDF